MALAERTVTTIPVKTWPKESEWSSWLKEPILPPNHEITQINLVERVTVKKPDGTEEEIRNTRHSAGGHGKSRYHHDHSQRHSTGRVTNVDEHRSSSRVSSEERRRKRHDHRRRSFTDKNKPLPPLPHENGHDRHTTGRITNHHQQIQTEDEHVTRSLDTKRYRRSGEMKSRGTSMHGQIFLQDGSPAPESTEFLPKKKQDSMDFNSNRISIASGTMTLLELEEPIQNGGIHEKDPLESGSLSSDDFKPPDNCCAIPSSLIYAVSVTLACFWCFPIGIYAVHRALQIQPLRRRGDVVGAMKASRAAGFWATVALVWGALVFGIFLVIIWLFSGFF